MAITIDQLTNIQCPPGTAFGLGQMECLVAPCPQGYGCWPTTTTSTTTSTTTTFPGGAICPTGTYWNGSQCMLLTGSMPVPQLPNVGPSIATDVANAPFVKNCIENGGNYDFATGRCLSNVQPDVIQSPTPTLPSGQAAIATHTDNTQKYILYGLVALVAYSVLFKRN